MVGFHGLITHPQWLDETREIWTMRCQDSNLGLSRSSWKARSDKKSHVSRADPEKYSTALLDAVNDLLICAEVSARTAGHAGLVLIIDGLDKLVRRDLGNGNNTHDRLFIDRSEQLADLKAHAIYTVPISLIYSPGFRQLQQSVGEHNAPVSMFRLRPNRDLPVRVDSPGMAKMREMVAKRCDCAGTVPSQAFDDEATLSYLREMSGSHPHHLMMFLQAACNELDELQITRPAAEKGGAQVWQRAAARVARRRLKRVAEVRPAPTRNLQGRAPPADAISAICVRV